MEEFIKMLNNSQLYNIDNDIQTLLPKKNILNTNKNINKENLDYDLLSQNKDIIEENKQLINTLKKLDYESRVNKFYSDLKLNINLNNNSKLININKDQDIEYKKKALLDIEQKKEKLQNLIDINLKQKEKLINMSRQIINKDSLELFKLPKSIIKEKDKLCMMSDLKTISEHYNTTIIYPVKELDKELKKNKILLEKLIGYLNFTSK